MVKCLMNVSSQDVRSRLKSGRLTICVMGIGRIGLPMATVFAKAGARVIAVDIDQGVIDTLNSGKCRFADEPGLASMVEEVVKDGKLHGTMNVSSAVSGADIVILCVPTPVDESKVPDYSAIIKACNDVGSYLKNGTLVIVESTVGPGTVENLIVPILEKASKMKAVTNFNVASCPERADPGRVMTDLYKVPRIVGGLSPNATKVTSELYRAALGVEIVEVSSPKAANAIKLTENIFRDVNIALMNEFAVLYEKLGIDIFEVIKACSTKYNFVPHYPGVGVGGPCLPSNPYYMIVEGVKVGNIPLIVRMAREVNDRMPDHVVTLVTEALNEVNKTVRSSTITIMGVAYKPDVHDIQLTPIERVFDSLKSLGAKIRIFDPMFKGEIVFGERVFEDSYEAIKGTDCIFLGTGHSELKKLDLDKMAKFCSMPAALVDAQNVFNPLNVKKAGFAFRGVGRPTPSI